MANKYDEYYDFRMAQENDIPAIMQFLKTEWDENHILANDRDFFNYHYHDYSGHLNIFLMLEKSGIIAGMIGITLYSSKNNCKYFSASVTKVRKNLPIPMSGLEMMRRVPYYKEKFIEASCGTNPVTILPLFKKVFHFDTGLMNLHYIGNPYLTEYKLIKAPIWKKENCITGGYNMKKIDAFDKLEFDFDKQYDFLLFKDKEYLEHRYLNNPILEYDVYAVFKEKQCEGIIFFRKVSTENGSLLFLVDYVGDIYTIGKLKGEFLEILRESKAECLHFMEFGMPKNVIEQAGFIDVNLDSDEVIIPTYFEPFSLTNVKKFCDRSENNIIVFKGFGDQDNPRLRRK